MVQSVNKSATIFTVGHSTRSVHDFVSLLSASCIDLLADVRTIPKSRHNPQFNIDVLPASLVKEGIDYLHLSELGGLRRANENSINTGWRNASFRGFADYMQTLEFEKGLGRLIEQAGNHVVAIMCAEAVPWRCHRSMIADALVVRGITVKEIVGAGTTRNHALTRWAKVDGNKITYP